MSDPVTIADYIRKAAAARGIDPEVAVKVYNHEGRGAIDYQSGIVKNGVREPSYGPFQLYTGGGLGNTFQKETGLNPADPSTWRENIDFALDVAKKDGWRQWYGAKNAGLGRWDGIGQPGAPVPTGSVNPDVQPAVPDVFSPVTSGHAASSTTGPDTPDISSVFRLAANPPDLSAGQKVATLMPFDQQEPADFQQVFDPRTTRRSGVKRR